MLSGSHMRIVHEEVDDSYSLIPPSPTLKSTSGRYWNLVFIVCFASPLLIGTICYYEPRFCCLVVPYFIYHRFISRPDLSGKGEAAWRSFGERERGYHAFRNFTSLRLHMSPGLCERPVDCPVIIGVHPHGIASDYRILCDGMLYHALPGMRPRPLDRNEANEARPPCAIRVA